MKAYKFSILLAVLVCLVTALCVSAGAETYSGDCGAAGSNVTWSLDTETGVLTISGTGEMTNYSENSYSPWIDYARYIKTVGMSEGVTVIGDCAFAGCSKLVSITMPNSVTAIGDEAFGFCSALLSVELGNNVTSIGAAAFKYCHSLVSITIPESLTSIGESAFNYCHELVTVTIPNSVTSIGNDAFASCDVLTILCHENSAASSYASNNNIPVRYTHFYEWTVIEEPTFETPGTEQGICTICQHTVTRDIPVLKARLTQQSVTAMRNKASGVGVMRFIARLEVAEGVTVTKVGTYISLVSFNSDGVPSSAGARVAAMEQTINGNAPLAFALDLSSIPAADAETSVYAWAYADLSDGTRMVLAFAPTSVSALLGALR